MGGFKKKQSSIANGVATRYENHRKNNMFNNVSNSDMIQGRKEMARRIESGEYSLQLSRQHFLKHKYGTVQYADYEKTRFKQGRGPQSILSISEDEAQNMINSKSWTGISVIRKSGIGDIEYVECDTEIGTYYKNLQSHATKRCAIHHGKKSSHIFHSK